MHHNRRAKWSEKLTEREMKLLKGIGITLCLIVICLLVAPTTKANEQPGNAVVTFGVPVEVPGIGAQILPAGDYRFTALESSSDRDIIQISSVDGSHVFTTMLGVPNLRLKAPDLITVVYTGRPAADPMALKAWYCPGRTWGDTIVYEKPRASQLAKEANEAVLSTSVALANSSVAVLKTAAIEAVSPSGETVAMAQVVDAPSMVAPALAVAAVPAVATTPNSAEVPTVAAVSLPAAEPAVAVVPVTEPAPAVADISVAAGTPTAAIGPPAISTPPATADPAAASAPATIGEPVAASAPGVSAEPGVAIVPAVPVAPVVPIEPPVAAEPVATAAPTVTAEPAAAPSNEVATAALPQTASVLPLVGLVGMLLLGVGLLMTGLMRLRP
jgi:hypothetical protein